MRKAIVLATFLAIVNTSLIAGVVLPVTQSGNKVTSESKAVSARDAVKLTDAKQDARSRELDVLFDASKRKDLSFLKKYRELHQQELERDKVLNLGYYLSLYEINPGRYEGSYINAYPTDSQSLRDIFVLIDEPLGYPHRMAEPRFIRFLETSEILKEAALKGNELAIKKCLLANVSSGSVAILAEILSDANWRLFQKYPKKMLKSLLTISSSDRKFIYGGFATATDEEGFAELGRDLLKIKSELPKKEQALVDEIVAYHLEN